MDEERFHELFTETKRWVLQARRLKIAGDHFIPHLAQILREMDRERKESAWQGTKSLERIELLRSLSDARAMLYGLCIENACKASLVGCIE